MALQFFFDECADEDVAHALTALGLDVVTVSGLKRKGLSDVEQFDFAKKEGRVTYSTDHDFLKLTAEQLKQGQSFPGLAFHAPGARTKRQIIDYLVLMNDVFEPADMVDHIEYI